MRVISYGGGVQSTALVVLAATGQIPPVDAALFSNVGDDSEHPATLNYVRDVAAPWARERGVEVVELYKTTRDGTPRTLMNLLQLENTPSIPVYLEPAGAPANRSCTNHFKVAVIEKWLKANGASRSKRADVLIGISTDEFHRANNKERPESVQNRLYPLIDLCLDRTACQRLIADVGLPVPPKSACFFCPFHRPHQWAEMRRDQPDLFQKAADIEDEMNKRRASRGKPAVYLTRLRGPLREVINEAQDMLPLFGPDADTCDEGVCWV